MAEVDLLHRIYTHAIGGRWETTGAHLVPLEERDAASVLSADALADLDDLLRKVVPAGNSPAWVVRRFVSGNDSYGCVVTSDPGLVFDSEGRNGLITHARLARLDAGEAWLDAPALVEAAMSIPIAEISATPAQQRLAAYLNLATVDSTVTLRAVPLSELQQLPRPFLTDFLASCLVVGSQPRTELALPAGNGTIGDLALAWCAVPVGLQRLLSWAVGVADGCPVSAVFSSSGKLAGSVAGEKLVECVNRYVTLLHDGPQDFSSVLRNPEISSAHKLDDVVQRAMIAAPLSMSSTGKGEMSKKDKGKGPRVREEGEPLEPETISEMERQYRAQEASLRMYVDQRVTDLEARLQNASSPQPKRAGFSWAGFAVGLVAAGAIALFALMEMRRRSEEPQITELPASSQPTAVREATTVEPRPTEGSRTVIAVAVKRATESGVWAEGFRDLIATNGAVVNEAILAAAVDPDVDVKAADKLKRFSTMIAAKQNLLTAGRDELRRLLLDYVAARVASDEGEGGKVKVDGNLDDAVAVLDGMKGRYGVKNPSFDLADRDLQSEIVLRWMEKR